MDSEGQLDQPSTSTAAISRRRLAFRQPVPAPRELTAPSPSSSISVTDPEGMEMSDPGQAQDASTSDPNLKSTDPPKRKAWSFDEVCAFFEGIKIHGKDFDSVVKAMSKRKVEKSKDHVKTFFFNSAKAYKQMLAITDDDFSNIPRDARELFLLVNACEWKRKTMNMKVNVEKLKELLFDGVVNVRVGRKLVNIKTPPCPALCRYFTCRKADKIPNEVFVHLEPTSNEDHIFMQNQNQNPFLRVKLNTNDRIAKLLEFLHKKWESPKATISITLWPDSSCEVASLTVTTVETSPFITISLNKLIKNVEENKDKVDPKKTPSGTLQLGQDVNTKTKPSHEIAFPRPFTLTDQIIAEGITQNNIKHALVAELFCVCGRKNPIQLRYQIETSGPSTSRNPAEPWKSMIQLLNRGYGECMTDWKRDEEKKRKDQKSHDPNEPCIKKPRSGDDGHRPINPESDIVRQENEAFETQLAQLRKTSRQKTVPNKRKSANPVLATVTPQLSIRPTISSPKPFAAPTCTVIPKKVSNRKPAKRAIVQEKKNPSTSMPASSSSGKKSLPVDFSNVSFSPAKRRAELELQQKRTNEFLSSLRTPVDTPVQSPRHISKFTHQQLFGDELSMSPGSTLHASLLEGANTANSSVIDFTDMMYQNIKDHSDTTMTNPVLEFSVSEVQQTYHDMMSSSQNSHDYIFGQFQKKGAPPQKKPK